MAKGNEREVVMELLKSKPASTNHFSLFLFLYCCLINNSGEKPKKKTKTKTTRIENIEEICACE